MPVPHTPEQPHTSPVLATVGIRCESGDHDECAGWWRYGPPSGGLQGFRCSCPCHESVQPPRSD